MPRLLIIDASSLIYRAFHVAPDMTNSRGQHVGAVQGFTYLMVKLLRRNALQHEHDRVVVVFDSPKPTFRHKLYKGYKAGRSRPEALKSQMQGCRDVVKALGIASVEIAGVEADDAIAGLAANMPFGWRATIATPDKDMMQVMHPGFVDLLNTHVKPKPALRTQVDIENEFGPGLRPNQIADVQALCGDPVDKVPGIRGVGGKTAAAMVVQFGSLESILAAPPSAFRTARLANMIKDGADMARLSYTLVKLDTSLRIPMQATSFARPRLDGRPIVALMREWRLEPVMRFVAREYGVDLWHE